MAAAVAPRNLRLAGRYSAYELGFPDDIESDTSLYQISFQDGYKQSLYGLRIDDVYQPDNDVLCV